MTDLLLYIAVSNVCISLVLALAALLVEATAKRPAIAHLLWVLVFVKLVTPPIVSIPLIAVPTPPDSVVMTRFPEGLLPSGVAATEVGAGELGPPIEASSPSPWEQIKSAILLVWLLGSGFILIWSLVRVYRFNRLVRAGSEVAPPDLQAQAIRLANRLGLISIPAICITSARISPMVWWVGWKVRVIVPQSLRDQMDKEAFQWILAHELAHVRRRDHVVRWLEWLACLGFWWNPLVWWGRRHLRANEEICCDDLVLSSLKPKPRAYADSLLIAIEHLAFPVIRPPAVASEINSGGTLERRFQMIVSSSGIKKTSKWSMVAVVLAALITLPIGVVFAQDYDSVAKRLSEAVRAGEISSEQAGLMMEALRNFEEQHQHGEDEMDWVVIRERLGKAVEEGRITREEAGERWNQLRRRAAHQSDEGETNWVVIRERLGKAVEEGRITREEAGERWNQLRRRAAHQSDEGVTNWVVIRERLGKAVEEGRITREEAGEKWNDLLRRAAASRDEIDHARDRDEVTWEAIKQRIEGAVERGEITREEADAKYIEMRRKISGWQ